MDAQQQYLFDLQGYIVLKSVVPAAVVAACNQGPLRDHGRGRLSAAAAFGRPAHAAEPLYFKHLGLTHKGPVS